MDNTNIFQTENWEHEELLPVTSDVVFKEIFGQEDSKPILQSFLNAALKLGIEDSEQIELLNTEINPENLNDKKSILDIKVRLEDKTSIDIEIQVERQYTMDRRSIYYVSRLCADQLNSGDAYSDLRSSIGLNIICYNMFDDDRYQRCFVLKDRDTNDFLSDLIRIEFLEIHKALRTISTKDIKQERNSKHLTEMEQWALFIGSRDREVLEMLTTQNDAIKSAYTKLQRVSEDDKKRAQALSREKGIRDWNSSMIDSYRAGVNAGRADGMAAGKKEQEEILSKSMIQFMKSKNTSEEDMLEMLIHTFQFTREQALELLKNTP